MLSGLSLSGGRFDQIQIKVQFSERALHFDVIKTGTAISVGQNRPVRNEQDAKEAATRLLVNT